MWNARSCVIVLGLLGVHCASPMEDGAAGPAAVSAPAIETEGPAPSADRDTVAERAGAPERAVTFDAVLDSPRVTSSAPTEDGGLVSVGLFSRSITFGSFTLASRGGDDVFVVKTSREGAVVWAVAVGSDVGERAPRVEIEAHRVRVVGLTDGGPDCGAGPTATWASDSFFLCVLGAADGATLAGGTFPTGSP